MVQAPASRKADQFRRPRKDNHRMTKPVPAARGSVGIRASSCGGLLSLARLTKNNTAVKFHIYSVEQEGWANTVHHG